LGKSTKHTERCWSKVARGDRRWLWRGATTQLGYGVFRIGGRDTTVTR
jgi:hypothetical protein